MRKTLSVNVCGIRLFWGTGEVQGGGQACNRRRRCLGHFSAHRNQRADWGDGTEAMHIAIKNGTDRVH
jgi:hypothetical protein